ncbi:MAG: carboxypeptidase regulatory-like domain-containing protein [Thermoanaerobaculia bacterium]|nr:carboxypeptidase regulatory-like domain-containing protein [Thermoanaerobaculia bacterium]
MSLRWALAFVMVAFVLGTASVAVAQETTGRLIGSVAMKSDQSSLPGATVEAVHVPTGTRYTALTQANGRYSILNVRVGGPYTISAQISGFRTQTQKDIMVGLGETRQVNFGMELESVTEAVVVTAEQMPLISPDRMGSGMAVTEDTIKNLPTVARQIQDFARTNPYVNVSLSDDAGSSMSVSGKNNRYNTIQIDGAVNNDLFGLGTYGTPGSQTYTQPISLDAVQELQVVVSPYDIKQSGFTGGAINAITRSGSNTWAASVYGSTRSESSVGDKYGNAYGDAFDRPVASFDSDTFSARIGGPILKDKLFFFLSGEMNRRSEPTGGAADGSGTNNFNNPANAARFRNILISKYGYDPGGLGDYNTDTDSDLLVGKIDFNLNESHNITLRHNYVDAGRDVNGPRTSSVYSFETAGYTITSKTNSTVGQVNSVFGSSSFNVGRIGYQTVRDSRAVPVAFPSVYICNNPNSFCTGGGTYNLLAGTERSSGANGLDQDILQISDDFTLIKGNHTITLGTQNEFFDFANVFIQDVTGTYFFRSLDAFEAGIADRYQVKYATGSDPRRPTQFGVQQWGLYAGDQWRVNDALTLNLGVRLDVPLLNDKPTFNPAVETAFGINTTEVPSSQVMVSPRVGFNWSPSKSGRDQVRGGVGVFAGRTPYVWISNAYGGTGIERIDLSANNVPFNPDPLNPPINFPPGTGAVSVDTIDPDFKFPMVLRSTLAYDRELPGGIRASVEGMFTKTLQDVFYQNINKVETGAKTFWGAPVYGNKNSAFNNVTYLTNTSRGEQQNFSLTLDKRFPFGLYLQGSYAYMNAKAAFEATSSVAYSNWQFQTHNGDIYSEQLTRSFFEIRDRFTAVASQSFRTGSLAHNIGLVFNAQSGQPYSMLMGSSGASVNGDGATGNDLLFVPENYSDVVWRGTGAPTEAEWNAFLSRSGLDAYRGRIAERNALDAPWTRSLDFHYDIEIPISVIKTQITLDLLNLINFIDSDAGLIRYVNFQTYTPLSYTGIDGATGKPIYTVNSGALAEGRQYSTNTLRSRWQLRLGARLSF